MHSSAPWALTWYIFLTYDILYTCTAQSIMPFSIVSMTIPANTITVKHVFTKLIVPVKPTHLVFQVVNCWETSGIIMLASQSTKKKSKKSTLQPEKKKKKKKRERERERKRWDGVECSLLSGIVCMKSDTLHKSNQGFLRMHFAQPVEQRKPFFSVKFTERTIFQSSVPPKTDSLYGSFPRTYRLSAVTHTERNVKRERAASHG